MKTTSRESIMARLRMALPESSPLPDLPSRGPWQTFDDPHQRFQEVLESVGGRCVRVSSVEEADQHLRAEQHWVDSPIRCSAIPGLGDATLDPNSVDDPHQLESVGYAVLPGHFAVAENGAIWVTDDGVRHRVLFFIPQHLALVVPADQVVHNLHEAYARIEIRRHQFCGFISGPSKTADIEQSLVIGAHGARSLTVYLVKQGLTASS